MFISFLLGYAALSLCLPDLGLMLDHSGLCQRHVGLMLKKSVYFVVLLASVGRELGPYWPYPGPLWAMVAPY